MVYFCQTYLIIRSSLTNTFTLTEKVLRRNEKTDYILIPIEIKFNRKRKKRGTKRRKREIKQSLLTFFYPTFRLAWVESKLR